MNFGVEYHIVQENVQALRDRYELAYASVVRSKVIDSIKNSAVGFETPMYFQNRTYLEEKFKENVQARIANEDTGFGGQIVIDDLHMLDVRIPPAVANKQLATAVQLLKLSWIGAELMLSSSMLSSTELELFQNVSRAPPCAPLSALGHEA